MEFGVQLGNLEPAQYRTHAQTAEALGYDLIVFPDHLVNEGPDRQLDPKSKAYDHIVMAAAVIEATKKIRVGHLVLCNLFRHPSITAQSLMTLDRLSNGRLLAGLGTGWTETEFKMSGIPFPPIAERLRMLDEALACILSLWKNETTTFDGEFYHLKDAILWPKPIQQPHPPIIIGGGGKGLLRLAAKYADYVNIVPDAGKRGYISMEVARKMTNDSFREKIAFLREEAKKLGRKPETVRVSNFVFMTMITETKEASRKNAEMMAPMFNQTAEQLLASPMILIGTPEECVTELRRRAKDWGTEQMIFTGDVGQNEKLLRDLHEKVLAHV
jgi:probable F420-dependent oxidoreductase